MSIRCQVAYLYAKHYNTNANLGLGKCKLSYFLSKNPSYMVRKGEKDLILNRLPREMFI